MARIAGIMAAKRTSELIPLCHPIEITFVGVELDVVGTAEGVEEGRENRKEEKTGIPWQGTGQGDAYSFHIPASSSGSNVKTGREKKGGEEKGFGRVEIKATVSCDGKTGVEMEALTAASTAALTVYDMCKAVDKGMRIGGLRVVRKEGGGSGVWVEGVKEDEQV